MLEIKNTITEVKNAFNGLLVDESWLRNLQAWGYPNRNFKSQKQREGRLKNKRKPSHRGLKRACDKLQKIIASTLWLLGSPGLHTSRVLKKQANFKDQSFHGSGGDLSTSLLLFRSSPTPTPFCQSQSRCRKAQILILSEGDGNVRGVCSWLILVFQPSPSRSPFGLFTYNFLLGGTLFFLSFFWGCCFFLK